MAGGLPSGVKRSKIKIKRNMNSKQKANDIYKSSMFLHGIEEAKLRALQTVQTVKCLVPYDQKKYWLEVEKQIELK